MSDSPAILFDDDGQACFFDAAGLSREDVEQAGAYTAKTIKARTPERYDAARAFLAAGVGILRICKLLSMHPRSVMAIRDESLADGSMVMAKQRLAAGLQDTAGLFAESLADVVADPVQLAKVPAAQRAVIVGILIDKAAALRGDASQIVEHRQAVPDRAAFARFLDGLPRVPVTVTDSGRDAAAVKEGGAAAGDARGLGDGGRPADAATDGESKDLSQIPEGSGVSVTDETRPAAADVGGEDAADGRAADPRGGGRACGGADPSSMRLGVENLCVKGGHDGSA